MQNYQEQLNPRCFGRSLSSLSKVFIPAHIQHQCICMDSKFDTCCIIDNVLGDKIGAEAEVVDSKSNHSGNVLI